MFVILGFGEQGKAILHYLLLQNFNVITVDTFDYITNNVLHNHIKVNNNIEETMNVIERLDLADKPVIINCLPTEYIVETTKLCIKKGFSVIDLAGVVEVEMEQSKLNEEAMKAGVSVIRACGLAPGIVSSFANYFINIEGYDDVSIYCGGLPMFPKHPLGYIRVFNESGVIKEYSGIARIIEDGEFVSVPTLSEREHIFIPSLGILEADFTSGGLSTLDSFNPKDISNLSYKTLRFPGHFDYVKNNIMDRRDAKDVLSEIISSVGPENPDLIVLHIDTLDHSETYFWEYDMENDIPAMAQATGYIAGEVAVRVFGGDVDCGVYNMERFDPYIIRDSILEVVNNHRVFSTIPIEYGE